MYGQTQLEEAGAQAFDLILLDLGLPDGDGSDLLVKLRRKQSTPVIIISAREAEGQKIRLLPDVLPLIARRVKNWAQTFPAFRA